MESQFSTSLLLLSFTILFYKDSLETTIFDVVIPDENLSERYVMGHQKQERDAIADKVKSFADLSKIGQSNE